MKNILHVFRRISRVMSFVWSRELRTSFRDEAVLVFILLVPLGYPLIYSFIYDNEVVREIPVAAIDESNSSLSREFIRLVDATASVDVVSRCSDLEEARELMRRHKIYGIIQIPEDFSRKLNRGQSTNVSVFSDLSSLLYYKSLSLAAIDASLDMNADIKLRYFGSSTTRQDEIAIAPLKYEEVNIFNPTTGMAAFLIPAVLVLILQQTMLLGVGVAAGTMKEKNMFRAYSRIGRKPAGTCLIVIGRALPYVAVYSVVALYVLGLVPIIFRLNHIGHFVDIAAFMLPYLLAVAFFAMTFSHFIKSREACMLLIVFTSLIFIFISGLSWPGCSVPVFWKYLSYLIPSTAGINGFVRLNSEGARLYQVAFEYRLLWAQAAFYFLTACLVMRHDIAESCRNFGRLLSRKTVSGK